MVTNIVRGRSVLARAHGDEARVCRLIRLAGKSAYITDNEGFNRLEDGEYAAKSTLFPIADLFEYDQTVRNGDTPDWSRLTPLSAVLVAGGGND